MVHLEVRVQGLEDLYRRIDNPATRHTVIGNILNQLRLVIQRRAMELAPAKTGNLRRSITSTLDTKNLVAEVGVNARYAYFVEKGTGLFGPQHRRIVTTHTQKFRWPTQGGPAINRLTGAIRASKPTLWTFASSTAGMPAHPYMLPAFTQSLPQAQVLIEQAGQQLLASMGGGQVSGDETVYGGGEA